VATALLVADVTCW